MTDIPEMPEVDEPETDTSNRNVWLVLLAVVIAVLGFLAMSGLLGNDDGEIDPPVPTTETTIEVDFTIVDETIVPETTIVEISTTLDPATS